MQNNGFDGKSGEFVLKQIFSMSMDKKEAASNAKKMINTFGSFSSIIESPFEELSEINSLNLETINLLHTIKNIIAFYEEDKSREIKRVYDSESAVKVLAPKFFGKKREIVVLLLLDGRGRILYNGVVNEGSVSEVPIYIRRVVELCLAQDAYTAMIAHNHPSGNPLPSKNDINATRDLEFALNGIDVELADHIIFGGDDYISMKSSEWLDQIKKEVDSYKNALKRETMEQETALLAKLTKKKD